MAVGGVTIAGQLELFQGGYQGPGWAGCELILRTDSIPFSVGMTWSQITEANFSTYARHVVVFGSPAFDPVAGDVYAVDISTAIWHGPPDSTGQLVYSWALISPSASSSEGGQPPGPQILAAGQLDAPTNLYTAYDLLALTCDVALSGSAEAQTIT
jgi:hypothetical protein